jgi:hypothetical protein
MHRGEALAALSSKQRIAFNGFCKGLVN